MIGTGDRTPQAPTAPAAPAAPCGGVLDRLAQLAASGASGRLLVRGPAGTWWVHLHEGGVCGAERAGRPTMLVAMGEAGLFTAEAWRSALHGEAGPSWSALAGGSADRLASLATFARTFVGGVLDDLVAHVRSGVPLSATFTPGTNHPFGALTTWPLDELVEVTPAVPTVDPAEFLALLEEASPYVRRTPGRAC